MANHPNRKRNSYRDSPLTVPLYWDYSLTEKGRANILTALGRAEGWQYMQWNELPRQLRGAIQSHLYLKRT